MTRSASRWRADRIVRMTASMAAALGAPNAVVFRFSRSPYQ